MIRRVCAAAAMVAAVASGALPAVPARADGWSDRCGDRSWSYNWSGSSGSSQSGNNFGDVSAANRGEGASTNVNNVNGIASTATHGGITVTYIFG
ncbi:hypothetical protein OHA25_53850 [Nonomuraea sp. NBC_00507]|uniref:hypothetical protein n=1 Tax=unclassified Nonomuraea TaxID=2593643 RepID=UPI00273AEF2A|nr:MULTISPECIES: hypothetical protein [unclassified Nonomuraea]MDP4509468.1 hypothetical protein [Nonomuraea sp. G32]